VEERTLCSHVRQIAEWSIRQVSLIDLHLHLDGSISPEAMVILAEMSDYQLPVTSQEKQFCLQYMI
ncbi:MAG: hypothetical protein RR361_06325, partial [Anaerovorax sp.]